MPEDWISGLVKSTIGNGYAFGNPTAYRLVNGLQKIQLPDGKMGNVLLSQYDNWVIPQIQLVDGKLKYISDPMSKENIQRSYSQGLRLNNADEALRFTQNYKTVAPMNGLIDEGYYLYGPEVQVKRSGGQLDNSRVRMALRFLKNRGKDVSKISEKDYQKLDNLFHYRSGDEILKWYDKNFK